MSTSLYVLSDEYKAAAAQLADLDLPPEVVADTLEGLAGALEVKATNVAMFARNLEASAEAIREAERAMALRRKAIESRAEHIRQYLKANMERAGISKIESPYFTLAIKQNPAAVVIDAESQIPVDFMRQPEMPPAVPDKKAIAEALKAGQTVSGAHLERGTRLDIR